MVIRINKTAYRCFAIGRKSVKVWKVEGKVMFRVF